MARLLTLVAVVASLVGFIAQESGSHGTWVFQLTHASYVLVALSVVAALLSRRSGNELALVAQVLAAATALVFTAVAIAKYYTAKSFPFPDPTPALDWLSEAQLFSVAALAFGLTLARRRHVTAMAGLLAAAAVAVGCGIYAITLQENFAAYVWWLAAGVGAFLAAAAAAGLERAALGAPVPSGAGGDPGSDAGVE